MFFGQVKFRRLPAFETQTFAASILIQGQVVLRFYKLLSKIQIFREILAVFLHQGFGFFHHAF